MTGNLFSPESRLLGVPEIRSYLDSFSGQILTFISYKNPDFNCDNVMVFLADGTYRIFDFNEDRRRAIYCFHSDHRRWRVSIIGNRPRIEWASSPTGVFLPWSNEDYLSGVEAQILNAVADRSILDL